MKEFYSNGKLLLTGEYAVLDGAQGLALPTKYGQYLAIKKSNTGQINWQSLNDKNTPWFTADIALHDLSVVNTSDVTTANRLVQILKEAHKLNTSFLETRQGYYIDTKLTFPKDWGLGSSSTLINNMANWAQVDPYTLLEATFSGSGYDIACAQNDTAILYQKKGNTPKVEQVDFAPPFKDQLFFIYLNKKQNSRNAINAYRQLNIDKNPFISAINKLTQKTIKCGLLSEFEEIIAEHERLLSINLKIPTIKEQLFHDYRGSIKSLGAWGGDFVLVTGNLEDMDYFSYKGYTTILPYSKMIL